MHVFFGVIKIELVFSNSSYNADKPIASISVKNPATQLVQYLLGVVEDGPTVSNSSSNAGKSVLSVQHIRRPFRDAQKKPAWQDKYYATHTYHPCWKLSSFSLSSLVRRKHQVKGTVAVHCSTCLVLLKMARPSATAATMLAKLSSDSTM